MSGTLVAALGVAAGAVILVAVVTVWVRYCLLCTKNASGDSDTNSSDVSLPAIGRSIELTFGGAISYPSGSQGSRAYALEELNLATKSFSTVNLIGHGTFGEVYKGLLQDGMVVAIKRRVLVPRPNFIEEVRHLSSIRHQNLASLLGFCQENDMQMLIYEYISNGSVTNHLYGASKVSSEKLEFKHRLLIAHGAAKGLSHLHSLNPPVIHMNFRTANVLLDADFIPKVSDAGIRNLIDRIDGAGASSYMSRTDVFLDPEVKQSGRFSLKSDVYSFGVFLLELVSGQEARSDQSIIELVQNPQISGGIAIIVDYRIGNRFSSECMKELLQLTALCLKPSNEGRPFMNYVVLEIERIYANEMNLTTITGEGNTTVTLGSQLFTSSRVSA